MTVEEKLEKMLYDSGLFPEQAKAIIKAVKQDSANKAMRGRWTDNVEDYPSQLLAVLWISVKRTALEWIDENLPQAWFRPLFEN